MERRKEKIIMRKNLLWIFLIVSLILSVFGALNMNITGVSAVEFPAIMVVPETIMDDTMTPGTNFTISIKTDYNGTDVWSYQFTLFYNASVLHAGVNLTDTWTGDGANRYFFVTHIPILPGSISVYVGGVLQVDGVDYVYRATHSLGDGLIMFAPGNAPANGAEVKAYYLYGVVNGDLITKAKHDSADFSLGTFNNTEGRSTITLAYFFYMTPDEPDVTSGPGILANITFTVVGYGVSNITLGDDTKLMGYDSITHSTYEIIDAQIQPDHIQHGYFSNMHEIAVIDVMPAADQAYPTWTVPLNITVTVLNNVTAPVNFTVRAYYENVTAAYEIGTQNVTNLSGGSQLNLTFSWNVTDVGWGIYTIKANVTLTGDVNPANDEFVYSNVTIKIPGDIQGDPDDPDPNKADGDVDRYDYGAFAQAYGYLSGQPGYNVECDIDRSGKIDRYDYGIFALNYGKSTTKYP